MTDFEEQLIKSPEPSFEQLTDGTKFMIGMVQAGSGTDWSQKMPEFEDFLGIGDEASKLVQEQKSKARILQSLLAAEDAEEAGRKMLKMKEKAALETEDASNADEVVQAIKDICDECPCNGLHCLYGYAATVRKVSCVTQLTGPSRSSRVRHAAVSCVTQLCSVALPI
ncbi:hypothetical protein JCGZ_26696 [Jatropha curcas]|uniref:Uncharacterized protein n=1 Tax=Jatropha curcas TaxID=180498 RepID=A0A067JK70_JATCU|nr:hypothetical protein JCGZ_26696 [Jatropha curcas]